jgi:COMPASS component SWD1
VLDPFAQKYPEAVDSTLTSSTIAARFNRTGPFAGHYLAAGGSDGVVEIWSIGTRGLVRILEGHVKPVVALSYVTTAQLPLTLPLNRLQAPYLHLRPLICSRHRKGYLGLIADLQMVKE